MSRLWTIRESFGVEPFPKILPLPSGTLASGLRAKVVGDDPGSSGRQDLLDDRHHPNGIHVLDRLGVNDGPEGPLVIICRKILEAAVKNGDASTGAVDVLNLENVGRQAGRVESGPLQQAQHSAPAATDIENRCAGNVDQLQDLLSVSQLRVLHIVEADSFRRHVRIVEVTVVEKIALEHLAVQVKLRVFQSGREPTLQAPASDPPHHMMRQECPDQDLTDDAGARKARIGSGCRLVGLRHFQSPTCRSGGKRQGSARTATDMSARVRSPSARPQTLTRLPPPAHPQD